MRDQRDKACRDRMSRKHSGDSCVLYPIPAKAHSPTDKPQAMPSSRLPLPQSVEEPYLR